MYELWLLAPCSLSEEEIEQIVESEDSSRITTYWQIEDTYDSEEEAYAVAEEFEERFPLISKGDDEFYF
jgi:hypothetical protein